MRKLFKGGVHPEGNKALTQDKQITVMPPPQTLYVSLSQHIGKPAECIVEVGQSVKMGELIAQAAGVISANVFAPVSGVVKAIEDRVTPSGRTKHVVIENDGKYDEVRLEPIPEPTPEQIRARIAAAGIVGMGGAGFPTAVKASPKTTVDTLIINAAECEPYITCDARILIDHTREFVSGVQLLSYAVGAYRTMIAIEDNKPESIAVLNDYLTANAEQNITVFVMPTKYPQGAEKQIVYAATKRKVPLGKLPADVGVVVSNVHTALSTHYAVYEGIPLYKRVMTVSGQGIKNPANLWVTNGTLYNDVIEYLGGLDEEHAVVKMINGGPMMGVAVSGGTVACTKTTSCLLLLTADEAFTGNPSPCINCANCAKVCPMHLMPMYMDLYARAGDLDTAVKYGLNACIECGSCTYICPAKRTLVQSFRLAKKQLKGRTK